MEIDIVVPVWNRPMETRSCLIDLIEHSPSARFILVNNGSDRETERLLQDFAEALDMRALLLSTGYNRGIIRAINIGLERAEAPYIGIMRSTCNVRPGWLDPLMEVAGQRPETGLLSPRVADHSSKAKVVPQTTRETTTCSLHAMVIRKALFDDIGGLNEDLDGGLWCARDYSRRAYHAGYLTFVVDSPPVSCRKEIQLGSQARREEAVQRSASLFTETWGKEHAFCIWFPKGTLMATLHERWSTLLKGARQGHAISLIVPHSIYRELMDHGYDRIHDNITIPPPPRFFAESAAEKALASLRQAQREATAVAGIDGISFPGVAQSLPYSALEKMIRDTERERYDH